MNSTELQNSLKEIAVLKARLQEDLYNSYVASAVNAIVVNKNDGKIEYSTLSANQLFGYDNLVGMNITDLMPERYRERHSTHLEDYKAHPISRPMGQGDMQLFGMTKSGTEFGIEIGLKPANSNLVVAIILKTRQ
jgi:PAS domain S-box-containing protein